MAVRDRDEVEIDLRQRHVCPQALLETPLANYTAAYAPQAGRLMLGGPYVRAEAAAAETTYLRIHVYRHPMPKKGTLRLAISANMAVRGFARFLYTGGFFQPWIQVIQGCNPPDEYFPRRLTVQTIWSEIRLRSS